MFSIRALRLYFPRAGALGCTVCHPVHQLLPRRPATAWPAPLLNLPPRWFASRHLAASPLRPGCPSPPLLLVWMNVSSSSPWLSDFHTVRFSGSSGWFLFFKLLLSFFWLCEEVQCVYLCLHLCLKSPVGTHLIQIVNIEIFRNTHTHISLCC